MAESSAAKKKKNNTKNTKSRGTDRGKSAPKRAFEPDEKKSASGKTASGKTAQESAAGEIRESLGLDVTVISIFASAVLLFIGEVGFGGVVLDAVSRFTFGIFGLIAYILPFVLALGTLPILANRQNPSFRVKAVSLAVFSVFLMTFFELLKTGGDGSGIASYISSYHDRTGGGLIGGLVAGAFYKGFGTVAAWFLDIIGLFVSLLFFFGKSFVRRAEHKGRNIRKRRELAAAERETRRELDTAKEERYSAMDEELPRRKPMAGRGVSLDTALQPKAESSSSDAMSEITAETLSSVDAGKEAVLYSREKAKTSAELLSGKQAISPDTPENPSLDRDYVFGAGNGNAVPDEFTSAGREEDSLPFFPPDEMPVIVHEDRQGETAGIIRGIKESTDSEMQSPVDLNPSVSPEAVLAEEAPAGGEGEANPVAGRETEVSSPAEVPEPARTMASAGAATASSVNPQKNLLKNYRLPETDLLDASKGAGKKDGEAAIQTMAGKLQKTLENFGVKACVTNYMQGPAVTRFEIEPETGVKVSKILNLSDDIKLNLAVPDIRMEAPIPGKAAIGIEVPNAHPQMVNFRELMESSEFRTSKSNIAFAAGRDIAGNIIISDIAKMPHLLIAGATGSGKSVCINTIIMSLLYKARPDEVKFIMIDPKIVELSVYNGIPHLLVPVVTDPKKAAGALQWAVTEMTTRYKRFADAAVRDMKGYNAKVKTGGVVENGAPVTEPMPQIVVIVDELADLMMVAGKEVEKSICRLAQLARAAGIHLIIATQRPSADVITGLIKANMPSKIAFAVTSGVDSRVVLDMNGAEKLLGKGDMLYFPQGIPKPLRVQGAYVSDEEVGRVCDFIRTENAEAVQEALARQEATESDIASHEEALSSDTTAIDGNGRGGFDDGRDEFFADAGRLACEKGKISIGMMQRAFRIGFNRAARIMDQLDEAGVVGPDLGTKPRTVLMKPEEFENYLAGEGGEN